MLRDHLLQYLYVFLIKRVEVDHFFITVIAKFSFNVVHISNATTHTSRKIPTCVAKHYHSSTSHVFTTMITHTFYDSIHTGVTNAKTFTCLTANKCFTGSGSIKS